jgi:hypothetical protein
MVEFFTYVHAAAQRLMAPHHHQRVKSELFPPGFARPGPGRTPVGSVTPRLRLVKLPAPPRTARSLHLQDQHPRPPSRQLLGPPQRDTPARRAPPARRRPGRTGGCLAAAARRRGAAGGRRGCGARSRPRPPRRGTAARRRPRGRRRCARRCGGGGSSCARGGVRGGASRPARRSRPPLRPLPPPAC